MSNKNKNETTRKKDTKRVKTTRRGMLKFKFYRVKVSDMIRIIGEEEACVGYQEFDI